MKCLKRSAPLFLAVAVLAGCSTAKVTSGTYYAKNTKLERPGNILVYDFAASMDDLPHTIPLNAGYAAPDKQPTPEALAAGRELGAEVAKRLVDEIHDMGFAAERATDDTPRNVGDMIIAGYFGSVSEGSRLKRLAIGFGSGSAEITTEAAGFLVTENGLLLLGSRSVDSGGGGKGPGMFVPLAVTIATANPIGLVVGGAVKATNEMTGRSTVEGAAKRTADELGEQLREAFRRQGWVE